MIYFIVLTYLNTYRKAIKHQLSWVTTCISIIQGEQGVIEVLELLKQELQLAMALSGKIYI